MHTWSNASPGGDFRGGRGGGRGSADERVGRRIWGYAGPTTGTQVASTTRLSKSTSLSGDSGDKQSSLWSDQGRSGTVVRGGYWGRPTGRGAVPRGRGGSSQGSELRTSTSADSGGHDVSSAPSTRSEDFQAQSRDRSTNEGRGGATVGRSHGTRGGFTGRGRSGIRGGYEGRGRGGQIERGRGRGDTWADGSSGRGRGRGREWTDATSKGNEQSTRGGRGVRGSWTPRGGRGGRGSFQGQEGQSAFPDPAIKLPPPRDIMGNLIVPAIARLTIPDVSLEEPLAIEDFKCISSYTWSTDKNPTIIVPGAPRQWLDRPLPIKVPFDRGIRIFHEDALHMGAESTLLPLFRAIDALVPQDAVDENAIDWTTVDLVTDRNNLRKLLRWVREPCPTPSPTPTPSPSGVDTPASPTDTEGGATASSDSSAWDPRKDFRIDMQLGGTNTVLMHRWATQALEWVEPPQAGCRANFERESTGAVSGCEGGGHYRIVQYNIGGLNIVVRFEVDAFEDPEAALALAKVEIESPVSPKETSLWEDTPAPNSTAEWGFGGVTESPAAARQKFTKTNDASRWGGPVSEPSDWGVSEPSPALHPLTRIRKDVTKLSRVSTTKVVSNAAVWAGAAKSPSAWGTAARFPGVVGGKKGKDDKGPWEIKSDASAWGPVDDAAAWGVGGTEDDAAAWGPVDDPSAWEPEVAKDDTAAWSARKSDVGTSKPQDARANVSPGSQATTAAEFDTTSSLIPVADLKVVRTGALLPQSNILELATRSTNYLDNMSKNDLFLQMFLTQTPAHLLAVHQRGSFERVIRQELSSEEFTRIAGSEDIRRGIAQFVGLLREIHRLVKEHGKAGRVSLVCEKGNLEMFGLVGQDGLVRQEELVRFDRAA